MKIEHYDARNKHRLIPPHMRGAVKDGEPPLYVLNAPDYDRVPLDTFLITTEMGTGGRLLNTCSRVVKPNDPSNYPSMKLSPGKRLLYLFWARPSGRVSIGGTPVTGLAVKMLKDAKRDSYRHMVFPGEPSHDMIAAFKIACDTRRAWNGTRIMMEPTLLYRALDVEPLELSPEEAIL